MALLFGVDRDANGAISMTATGTIVPQGGIPVTAGGEVVTTSITGSPPAGSKIVNGFSRAADDTIQVTTDAIGIVRGGIAFTLESVLCITANAPDNTSKRAGDFLAPLVDSTGRVHVS
jgi:hypothetical protein